MTAKQSRLNQATATMTAKQSRLNQTTATIIIILNPSHLLVRQDLSNQLARLQDLRFDGAVGTAVHRPTLHRPTLNCKHKMSKCQ